MKTSFETRVSKMVLGSFVDINICFETRVSKMVLGSFVDINILL